MSRANLNAVTGPVHAPSDAAAQLANDDEIPSRLARRLRLLRKSRQLTLSELGVRTGISGPHLSRIESGCRNPSIATLLQLAKSYSLSLSQLVGEEEHGWYLLIRSGEGHERVNADATYRVLSGPDAQFDVVELRIAPGHETSVAVHDGQEWLRVLAGSAEVIVQDELIILGQGDSLQFDARIQHKLRATSTGGTHVLLVSTSPGNSPHR